MLKQKAKIYSFKINQLRNAHYGYWRTHNKKAMQGILYIFVHKVTFICGNTRTAKDQAFLHCNILSAIAYMCGQME
jgi:hypothetical protein